MKSSSPLSPSTSLYADPPLASLGRPAARPSFCATANPSLGNTIALGHVRRRVLVLYAKLIQLFLEFPLKLVSVVGVNGANTDLFRGDICRNIAL